MLLENEVVLQLLVPLLATVFRKVCYIHTSKELQIRNFWEVSLNWYSFLGPVVYRNTSFFERITFLGRNMSYTYISNWEVSLKSTQLFKHYNLLGYRFFGRHIDMNEGVNFFFYFGCLQWFIFKNNKLKVTCYIRYFSLFLDSNLTNCIRM